jgi:transketolase
VLAEKGFFDREELLTFASPGTRLQKHVDMCIVPGAELSTGSLGQGLSVGVGMAIADRMDKKDRRVFVLIGDGESQEGQIWEAAMYAGHLRLEKLIVFLDFNRCQVDGYVHEVCGIDPVDAKWRSFGWNVQTIDGNDINQIITALDNAHRSNEDRPQMIVCRTIKGKGISFMENQINWHSRRLTDGEYQIAMGELAEAELLLEYEMEI